MNESQKQELVGYLKKQLEQYREDPSRGENIAYDIAGLLSLESIRALPEDDILVLIMIMAGELELPMEHRTDETSWGKLSELIERL